MSNRGRHRKKKDNFKELMHCIKINPYWTPRVQSYKDGNLRDTWYPLLGQCTEEDIRLWFSALKNVYDKLIINDLTIIL